MSTACCIFHSPIDGYRLVYMLSPRRPPDPPRQRLREVITTERATENISTAIDRHPLVCGQPVEVHEQIFELATASRLPLCPET